MSQTRSITKTAERFSALSHAIERSERETSITPASADEIVGALGKLMVAFDIYDSPELKAKLALLTEALEGEPLWAIRKGIDDFSHGRVDRKRGGLPLASELRPHVADISAWAREVAKAEAKADQRTGPTFPPADGDGIKFDMSPEEQKAAGKWVADRYRASGIRSWQAFFKTMRWQETRTWLNQYRAEQARAA
jgi:hypothetical protein